MAGIKQKSYKDAKAKIIERTSPVQFVSMTFIAENSYPANLSQCSLMN